MARKLFALMFAEDVYLEQEMVTSFRLSLLSLSLSQIIEADLGKLYSG
jgi:hypothetical protein